MDYCTMREVCQINNSCEVRQNQMEMVGKIMHGIKVEERVKI